MSKLIVIHNYFIFKYIYLKLKFKKAYLKKFMNMRKKKAHTYNPCLYFLKICIKNIQQVLHNQAIRVSKI